MYDIKPLMSLKTVEFKPIEFRGLQYTPQIADSKILAQSLEKQEARESKARDQNTAIHTTLAKIRESLDPSEHINFDKMAANINNEIKAEIDAGNYQTAIKFGQNAADKIISDRDLQNKQLVNQKRNEFIKSIKSNAKYDYITKKRTESINKYT